MRTKITKQGYVYQENDAEFTITPKLLSFNIQANENKPITLATILWLEKHELIMRSGNRFIVRQKRNGVEKTLVLFPFECSATVSRIATVHC